MPGSVEARTFAAIVNVITHGLAPVVIAATANLIWRHRHGEPLLRKPHFWAIGLAGAAPDLLHPHLSLDARLTSWTHNIWFLLGFIPVAIFIARRWIPSRKQLTAWLMVFGCALHLFCDGIAGGIAWAYPFSNAEFVEIGRYFIAPRHWPWLDVGCVLAIYFLFRVIDLREAARPRRCAEGSG